MEREWILLHTNDVHSHFEAMLRIQTIFHHYTSHLPKERILRLDIGDCADRSRPETEGSLGIANVRMMNRLGYDVVALGNNEGLGFSKEELHAMYAEARFPVVCANVRDVGTNDPPSWLQPYTIIEKAGVRFGFFGLTAPFTTFYRALGWDVEDPIDVARRMVHRLRTEHGVDFVILLSHLGWPIDETWAEQEMGIDIILGAHTHHVCDPAMLIGTTTVAAAGKNGEYVGIIRLVQQPDDVWIVRGEVIATEAVVPDHALSLWWKHEQHAALQALEAPIGLLEQEVSSSSITESVLGNVLASVIRRHVGAPMGIVNAGQVLTALSAGIVTRGQLLRCCPSPIHPCRIEVRGRDIREALQQACDPSFIHGTFRGYGFRGEQIGTLCVDGMRIEWSGLPHARQIRMIYVGDAPLVDDRLYEVGTIDMFTFGVGYPTLGRYESVEYYLPEFLRDLLAMIVRSPEQTRWIAEASYQRYVCVEDGDRLTKGGKRT